MTSETSEILSAQRAERVFGLLSVAMFSVAALLNALQFSALSLSAVALSGLASLLGIRGTRFIVEGVVLLRGAGEPITFEFGQGGTESSPQNGMARLLLGFFYKTIALFSLVFFLYFAEKSAVRDCLLSIGVLLVLWALVLALLHARRGH